MDPYQMASLVGILFGIIASFAIYQWTWSTYPDPVDAHGGLPWADLQDEIFNKTRSSLRQLTSCSRVLQDGYQKYGKVGRPFIVSDASFQPQVMLPQEHIKWLAAQHDSVISVWPVRSKRRALGSMMTTVEHKSTIVFMDKVVSRFLTRNLSSVQADVAEEVKLTVDATLGVHDHDWHEVNVVQTFQKIGDRSGIRALFGLELCRDQRFVRILNHYKIFMGIGILASGQLPPVIRQVVGALLVLPFRICKARATRVIAPVIKRCMDEIAKEGMSSYASSKNVQHDVLTQSIRAIMRESHEAYRNDPAYIADQFLVVSFATLSSMSLVSGNLFIDILSTPSSFRIYDYLRSEANTAFQTESDWGNPAALKSMTVTDSVIRESIRFSSIQTRGILRAVTAKDGVTLPDGTHVPQGTWIGVPVEAVHFDDRFYERPFEYNPFRFVKTGPGVSEGGQRLEATDISDKFLGWSYGRYPCPGRWFAVQNLKLIIAYITLNYDIKPIDKRPPTTVFGDANVPSMTASISVRRRGRGEA